MILLDSDVDNTNKWTFKTLMLYVLILWLFSLIQPIHAFCLEYVSNRCITLLLKVIVHPKITILMSSQMFMTFFLQMNTSKDF